MITQYTSLADPQPRRNPDYIRGNHWKTTGEATGNYREAEKKLWENLGHFEKLRKIKPLTQSPFPALFIANTPLKVLPLTTMKTLRQRALSRLSRIRPGIILIGFYLLIIFVSAIILSLPICQNQPVDFADALFTSASAITITGLNTVNTAVHWSTLGQAVILLLIQVGAIGIMSLTTLTFLSRGRMSLSLERLYFQELAGSQKLSNAVSLVKKIILVTFLIEAIGVALLFGDLSRTLPPGQAFWYSLFHAISAFCNAGFALVPDSYVSWATDEYFLAVNSVLIICGGLGFLVLVELWEAIRRRRGTARFSLHLRMVVRMSAILLVGAAALLWMTDDFNFTQAVFHSVSSRSAGFNSLELSEVGLPAICLIILLMYIGTAPGSTGGGIKVTSLAVLTALGFQRFRGDNTVTLMSRSIPTPLVIRAVAVALIGVGAIAVTTILLVIFQSMDGPASPDLLRDSLFEATSAICTVGLSIGLTAELTTASKVTLIVAMIVGRLGLLTIAYGLAARAKPEKIRYAEGEMMIG